MRDNQVAVTSFGYCLPSQVLDNPTLIDRFELDATPEWIERKTGIRTRHWLEDHQTTSDIAVEAAQRVLDARGMEASALDRIILATVSPDHPSPATATVVARRLGARCPAFDVSAACAGFVYGLDLAAGSVCRGDRAVLVLAADARSRFIDKHERRASVLFADGAAGALVEPSEEPGLLGVFIGAEGRENPGVHMPAGGAAMPTTEETVRNGFHHLVVDPSHDIYDNFVRLTREACFGALDAAHMTFEDVDAFIGHQGNARMIEMVAEDLGLPPEIVVNEVHRHGNTAGASGAIVLAEAIEEGRLRDGDVVLLAPVGAGYTFGGAVIRLGVGRR